VYFGISQEPGASSFRVSWWWRQRFLLKSRYVSLYLTARHNSATCTFMINAERNS